MDGGDGEHQQQQQQQQQQQLDRVLSDISTTSTSTRSAAHTTTAAAATAAPEFMFTEALLQYSVDSFLSGQYDRPFKEDAPAPLPDLTPVETVDAALRALRELDVDDHDLSDDDDTDSPSHGAAVLLRFCAPLCRAERWGLSSAGTVQSASALATDDLDGSDGDIDMTSFDSWKELMRGSLTPHMLAKRLRSSQVFSGLLDWEHLDLVLPSNTTTRQPEQDYDDSRSTNSSNRADVDAVLYYSDDCRDKDSQKQTYNQYNRRKTPESSVRAPSAADIIRFHMVRLNGVWLIKSAERR